MSLDSEQKRWEKEVLDPVLKKIPNANRNLPLHPAFLCREFPFPKNPITWKSWDFPANIRSRAAFSPPCIAAGCGPCASMPATPRPKNRTGATDILLAQGQTGLSVAFDLPTQIGYDADDPMALGEVGKVGVSISSIEDMAALFDGIPLDKVSTSMTINAPAAVLLAMYIAVAKRQGVDCRKLRGTIQNDILKEYIARGTYIFPPAPSMRLITDIFRFCKTEVPQWNTISISGYHIREAGSTAVQEVAFTLADGIAYVQAAIDSGLNVDEFASQLSFFFNAHNNLLEEVAKFRAARRLWAKIMRDRFRAQDPRSWMLRFHTQTGGSTLTAQQPENNIVRVTLQALAAVLGGTQSLHTNSMDEALALPTEKCRARGVAHPADHRHESGAADTVDPLAGAYVIEQLTDEIEKRAAGYIEKIDHLGGALPAIERGYIQSEIQDAAYRYQKAVETASKLWSASTIHQGGASARAPGGQSQYRAEPARPVGGTAQRTGCRQG